MKLVKPTSALKKSKRVGRGHGSGLGTTAGRGHKGAGQRSGHKYRFYLVVNLSETRFYNKHHTVNIKIPLFRSFFSKSLKSIFLLITRFVF